MASYTSGPKEEARPLRTQLVKAGEYALRVLDASESQSSNGNDMIELKFEVLLDDGTPGPIVYDNLVFTAASSWKIDQFRRALGEEVIEGEEVDVDADDFLEEEFRAYLVQERDHKDKTKKRNRIGRYLEPQAGESASGSAAGGTSSGPVGAQDDDIPF